MNLQLAYGILDLLKTIQDAIIKMKDCYSKGDMTSFNIISKDIYDGLTGIQALAKREGVGGISCLKMFALVD